MNIASFRRGVLMVAASLLFTSGGTAFAQGSASTQMQVTASVPATCTITSPVALAFGNYDPVVSNATAALNVSPNALSVACTTGVTAKVGLDNGQNYSAPNRRMTNGATTAAYLIYQIYTSAARTTIWNTTNTVSYTAASRNPTPLPVYGQIPGGQDVPVGTSYADTVTATITF